MKTKSIFFKTLTVIFFLVLTTALPAQNPPPPPPGGHGQTGNQSPPGGGVPVGSGLVILLSLGAAYGGKKVFDLKKQSS